MNGGGLILSVTSPGSITPPNQRTSFSLEASAWLEGFNQACFWNLAKLEASGGKNRVNIVLHLFFLDGA